MVSVNVFGVMEPFCCWLRPTPPNLELNLHCTYNEIMDAVKLHQWYPPNCHYCGYIPRHVDDFESHIATKHPGKLAYPGPTPLKVARALYIVESIQKELKDARAKKNNITRAAVKERSETIKHGG